MTHNVGSNRVQFRFNHNVDGPVFVVGTFNDWNLPGWEMSHANGFWMLDAELPPGEHQFRYYTKGQWFTDFASEGVAHNSFGCFNSIVRIPEPVIAGCGRKCHEHCNIKGS